MAVPIANLKGLVSEFLSKGGDFAKVSEKQKQPMIVKVFRSEPLFLINDKESYMWGYFTSKAVKNFERDFGFGLDEMKSKTLKITKFYLLLNDVEKDDYWASSYLGKQIKFVIEECTLGRELKRGVDVNKFVINIFRDRDIRLDIATYLHREALKSGEKCSFEKFLMKEAKLSQESISELLSKDGPKYIDERFKMREVVTCIVSEIQESEDNSQSSKRRSLKCEAKEDEEEEEKEEVKAGSIIKNEIKDKENVPFDHKKAKSKYKGKKPYTRSRIAQRKEEEEVPLSKIKMEPKCKEEIKNILIKTDFIQTQEQETIKKPKPITRK